MVGNSGPNSAADCMRGGNGTLEHVIFASKFIPAVNDFS